ncbi:MAG: hypothetical protein MJ182_01735 [Treponema sp.]|nr:hypothetical protein [Treponema sp.]
MKKLIAMSLIALTMTSLAFAAPKKAKKAKKGKGMNISVFTIQQRQQPPADNRDYKWIEENFGVTFNWDILVGDKDQKIGVLIASGDLPDMVEVDSEKFQGAGCLIDLKPLVEKYGPNLMKHYAPAWKKMIDQDSEKDASGKIVKEHIYSLPNYGVINGADQNASYNQNGFWIQKRVLKEFGYPEVKTVDQYFDLIEKYLAKYPETDGAKTIGFNIITADWEAFNLWNPPNFLAGYPNDGNGHVTKEGGKYVYTDNFADANAERWFKLANGYFQRGLIDPASFTDNRDQYYAKIAQGRVLGMFIQGWQFMYDAENTIKASGNYDRTYVALPVVFDETIKPHYRDLTLPNLQRGYGITTKCGEKKAIEIIKFLDTILEEKNQKRLYWGVEGEDYMIDTDGSVTGQKGAPYYTAEQRERTSDNNYTLKNKAQLFTEEAPKIEGSFSDGYPNAIANTKYEIAQFMKPIDIELLDAYKVNSYAALVDKNPPQNAGWYPMWQCNPSPENDGLEHDAAVAMTGFETLQRKYLPMMIMGKPADFDKTWKEYTSQMKPLTDVYNKFMQQQLDHRVEVFGGQD